MARTGAGVGTEAKLTKELEESCSKRWTNSQHTQSHVVPRAGVEYVAKLELGKEEKQTLNLENEQEQELEQELEQEQELELEKEQVQEYGVS